MKPNLEQQAVTNQLLGCVQWILPPDELAQMATVLAVSGGPDSVALAHLLVTQSPATANFTLAHFNHRLRGEESEQDEQFVRLLGQRLDCPVLTGHPDSESAIGRRHPDGPETGSSDSAHAKTASETEEQKTHQGQGLEALARNARYDFLKWTAQEVGARYILTAHSEDDQIETIIHHFFRGTGIRGLTGIQPVREWFPGVSLVRPFLKAPRKLILAYLVAHQIEYRQDSSNHSAQFTRNRIRNELLPLARDIFGHDPGQAIRSISDHCREVLACWEPQLDKIVATQVIFRSDQLLEHVSVKLNQQLTNLPNILMNEVWIRIWSQMNWPRQQMSRPKWNHLSQLASEINSEKINLPGNIMAERQSDQLSIWRVGESETV